MPQVIEVRCINAESREVLFDEMVLPPSKTPRDKEHAEAMRLAWSCWQLENSGTSVPLTSIDPVGEERFIPAGCNACWQYAYSCSFKLKNEDFEREVVMILFASYRLKGESK